LTRIVPDLGGERRAGAPGEQDRRHQRAELTQHREPDQVGDEDLGAEALHRHRRLEREDHPEQHRDQRDDRQSVDAHLLADPPDVLPAHALRISRSENERREGFADECDLRAQVAPQSERCEADFLDRRPTRRLGIEVVLEHRGIELLEQHSERRFQIRDLDAARVLAAQELDDQRDARAVAVLDAGGVDDHGPRLSLIGGAPRLRPQLGQRRGIEASRQRENAPAVRRIGDRERRHRRYAKPREVTRRVRGCCRPRARDRPRGRTARRQPSRRASARCPS
jgi:hypothetical protein